MVRITLNTLLISLLVTLLTSCSLPPTYSRADIENVIKTICKDEFNIEVNVWSKGKTIWVHAPINLIDEEDKLKISEEGEWDEDVLKKLRNIALALERAFFSIDKPPKFYCFIASNTKKTGVDLYTIKFIPDMIKYSMGRLSMNEMGGKSVFFAVNTKKAVNDTEGKHIDPYDLSMEEFIALLILQNIEKEYQSTEIKDYFLIYDLDAQYSNQTLSITVDAMRQKFKKDQNPDLPFKKVQKIAQSIIDMYSRFTAITKVKIIDKFNNETKFLVFSESKDELITSSESETKSSLTDLYRISFYFRQASQLYEEKKMKDAKGFYQKALEVGLLTDSSYFGLGNVDFYLGKYAEAIKAYKNSIEVSKAYADDTYTNIGMAYFSLADYHRFNLRPYPLFLKNIRPAIDNFKKAIEINPDNTTALLQLGFAYTAIGDERGIDCFNKVIEKASKKITVGWAYYGLGNYEQALVSFEKARQENKDSPEPYIAIGNVYARLWALKGTEDFWNKAVQNYKEALKLDPDSTAANYNLGDLHRMVNKDAEAIEYFNSVIEYCQEADIKVIDLFKSYIGLGNTYHKQTEYQKAIDNLTEALELDAESPLVYSSLGNIYMDWDKPTKAITYLEKSVELNPKGEILFANLGIAYYHQGQYSKARLNLNKAGELLDEISSDPEKFKYIVITPTQEYELRQRINDYLQRIPTENNP